MQASMSRRANCYDNAPTEGFQRTLKNGLMHYRRYATHVSRPGSRSLSISTCFTIASRVRPGSARLPVAGSIQAAIPSAKDCCLIPCRHTRIPTAPTA
jgi:transposase InsO family protein